MTKTTLSNAIIEARATACSGVIEIQTLEFRHPDMSAPLFVVSDISPLSATLETGVVVAFLPVPFKFKEPSQGTSPTPEAVLELSNVGGELSKILDDIIHSFIPIKVAYRLYTNKTLDAGPQLTPVPVYQIVSATGLGVIKITLRPIDMTKINFPTENYEGQ